MLGGVASTQLGDGDGTGDGASPGKSVLSTFAPPALKQLFGGEDLELLNEVTPGTSAVVAEGHDSSSRRIVDPIKVVNAGGTAARVRGSVQAQLIAPNERCWLCGKWRQVRCGVVQCHVM